jgi:hypothetical protein
METRFAAQRTEILDRAAHAIEGCVQLFGLPELHLGRSINWRVEPLSGKRTRLDHWSRIDYLNARVAGDKKVTWELNRCGHFVTLAQAYYLTGDERYAAAFAQQIDSWIEGNPPNRGINWSSSLEAAFRSIAWLWSLHLLAGSIHLKPKLMLRIFKSLYAHACHVETYLSWYFSPNTHLTGEALGLFYLGSALPEFRRAKIWQQTGLRILLEQLPIQVGADGVYFERASCYHRYTADFYLHLVVLAAARGIELPEEVKDRLVLMLDHLMWITKPDGSSPLIGDDDGGRLIAFGRRAADDFRDTLATGAALFGRGDWKHVAGDAPAELLWLLGPEGLSSYDRIQACAPAGQAQAFSQGGCYVLRDGWSEASTYAVVNCGSHGALTGAHAHSDALAFEFAALGKSWLIDPGTFTYTADASARDEFRATDAHNTVTIDGQPQSLPGGAFRWTSVAEGRAEQFAGSADFSYFEGSHDGYQRLPDPVSHTRSLFMVRFPNADERAAGSYLVVRDSFFARGSHRYALHYQLQPRCFAATNGNSVFVADSGGRRLNLTVFGPRSADARLVEGWASRGYLHRERALIAVFETVAAGPVEFVTFIMPARSADMAKVRRETCNYGKASGFIVSRDQALDVVLLSDANRRAQCGPLIASGRVAFGRFADRRLSRAVLLSGNHLATADGYQLDSTRLVDQCSIESGDGHVELTVQAREGDSAEAAVTLAMSGSRFEFAAGRHRISQSRNGQGWRLSSAG